MILYHWYENSSDKHDCKSLMKKQQVKSCLFITTLGTIEYEADLKHKNEMKRLEAELRGK